MLKYGVATKKSLSSGKHTTIQLYELPYVHQEVFHHQKQVSDLFFGDGKTMKSFFSVSAPSLYICLIRCVERELKEKEDTIEANKEQLKLVEEE